MKKFFPRFSTVYLLFSLLLVINCNNGAGSSNDEPVKQKPNPCVADPVGQACFNYCSDTSESGNAECNTLCTNNPTLAVCQAYCSNLGVISTVCETNVNVCSDANSAACLGYCGDQQQKNTYCSGLCVDPTNFGCQGYCSDLPFNDTNCNQFCTGTDRFGNICSSYCGAQTGSNSVCEAFCNGLDASNPTKSAANCAIFCSSQTAANTVCENICTNEPNSFTCMSYRQSLE